MSAFTMTQLAEHIDRLVAQHELRVKWSTNRAHCHFATRKDRSSRCCGFIPAGVTAIRIAPVTSRRRYATALHEIGHAIGERQKGNHRMVKEINASYTGLGISLEVDGIVYDELASVPTWYLDRAARVIISGKPRAIIPMDDQSMLEAKALGIDLDDYIEIQQINIALTTPRARIA